MSPQNLERSLECNSFCKSIQEASKHVHLVSLINKSGRVIETKLRDDSLISSLDHKDFEMLFMQRTLQTSMIREHNDRLGMFNYTITIREPLSEIILPFYDGIILVIVDSNIKMKNFTQKLSKLVYEFEKSCELEMLRNHA